MQTIIWAIGSIIILALIIVLVPLGYTKKGKLLVVLTSFILSLVGLAAVSTIPLWEAAIILLLLTLLAAYIMNNRMGHLLQKEEPLLEDMLDDDIIETDIKNKTVSSKKENLVEFEDELVIPESSSNLHLEKDNTEERSAPLSIYDAIEVESETELVNEDISNLITNDDEETGQSEDGNTEIDYLSDIESLMKIEQVVEKLEDLEDLRPLKVEEKTALQNEELDEQLDDFLFDFLLAEKEVAVEREDSTKEKISIQK